MCFKNLEKNETEDEEITSKIKNGWWNIKKVNTINVYCNSKKEGSNIQQNDQDINSSQEVEEENNNPENIDDISKNENEINNNSLVVIQNIEKYKKNGIASSTSNFFEDDEKIIDDLYVMEGISEAREIIKFGKISKDNNFYKISNENIEYFVEKYKKDLAMHLGEHNKKYSELLEIYVDNVYFNNEQKKKYKVFYLVLSAFMAIFPIIFFIAMNANNLMNNTVFITNSITFLSSLIFLPKIVAEYLFDKEEQKNVFEMVKEMMKYDKDSRNYIDNKKNDNVDDEKDKNEKDNKNKTKA